MAKYTVLVTENIKAHIYIQVEEYDDDQALEKARDEAFNTPLNQWTITDEDGDMEFEKELGRGTEKCDNCGVLTDNHHEVVWESTGDVELYCDNCHKEQSCNTQS